MVGTVIVFIWFTCGSISSVRIAAVRSQLFRVCRDHELAYGAPVIHDLGPNALVIVSMILAHGYLEVITW